MIICTSCIMVILWSGAAGQLFYTTFLQLLLLLNILLLFILLLLVFIQEQITSPSSFPGNKASHPLDGSTGQPAGVREEAPDCDGPPAPPTTVTINISMLGNEKTRIKQTLWSEKLKPEDGDQKTLIGLHQHPSFWGFLTTSAGNWESRLRHRKQTKAD